MKPAFFNWDLMSELNFIHAGLHPSWITVAGSDPANAYAHVYSCLVCALGWDLRDLEPGSRFGIASLIPMSLISSESQFLLFTKQTNKHKPKTKQKTHKHEVEKMN